MRRKLKVATDLKKHAHVVQSSDEVAQADVYEGGMLMRRRRGRPPSPARKVAMLFPLDPDLAAKLRASGPGYQTRVNALLREAVLGSGDVSRVWRLRASSAGKIAAHPTTARKAARKPRLKRKVTAKASTSRKPARKATRSMFQAKSKAGMAWLRSQRRKAATKRSHQAKA